MKLLRDPLGRPIPRVYFKTEDLDERCERKIADFMDRHCGGYKLPVPTDDLIRLVEADTDDLDLYADLPDDQDGHTTGDPHEDLQEHRHLSRPEYRFAAEVS